MKEAHEGHPVSRDIYDCEYFLTECGGWSEFLQTKGAVLPERLSYAFSIADVKRGMRVLDAGSGRGELLIHCAHLGAFPFGVDYSAAAVELAREAINGAREGDGSKIIILCGDVKRLPFPDGSFDRIFALDIVEHLHDWELHQALLEFNRALAPDGKLIVHTMPNRWYYAVGYPLFRAFQRLRGKRLPADPRLRWKFASSVHVNEQDPLSLERALRRAGFSAKIWLHPVQNEAENMTVLENRVKQFLSSVYPLKLVFCNSIFAIARRCETRGCAK